MVFLLGKHTLLRPSGVVENYNDSRVDLIEADTFQCCHCGHHHQVKKGKAWGTCHSCSRQDV